MGLKREIKLLQEENKYLKETILALTKRIEELEGLVKEKSKPAFVKEDIKEEPKQSGQKEGHVGYSTGCNKTKIIQKKSLAKNILILKGSKSALFPSYFLPYLP